ncbi:MAG: SusC/RagA family TonB-linked outer membrane protein [Bacteroidetes bacterium]|nr:SusC/RagA family TonB-linked outer membrane protein [Bacteroidota bacterium]
MRTKFSGILTLLLALVVQLTFAQEKTISGTITDESNLPLPGVNVIVQGTSNGTQTDFDGNYSINVGVGQVLEFSYLSYKTELKTVGASASSISFGMEPDASVLNEVVVTGFAVKKEKKALGYSVSSIQQEAIKESPQTDLTRVLTGKAAGINITTQNGLSGSANKVIIRGTNSFSGDNNALYVIDGVPISNDTNEAGDFVDGNMGSSRSFDIDPNNIERVDILKGLAATTLYGTEGRNGVILITTKTGSTRAQNAKQEVEISSSVFVNQVSTLPDYQNQFGGGFDQAFGWFYSNWGPGFYRDGLGGWSNDPAFDENGTLDHPYATSAFLATNYPDFQELYRDEDGNPLRYDWKPRNSVEEFFRKGLARNLSVSARGRSEDGKYGYGVVFSHLDEDGFTPGNNVKRNNLTISGDAELTNKIKLRGSMTYTKTDLKTPPVSASFGSSNFGAGSSIFGDLFYTPRSIDFQELPFELPDGASVYYRDDNAIQHPLWTIKNAKFKQLVNRVNGYAAIDYNITDNFNVFYQASIDSYSENNVNRQNRGGVGDIVTNTGFYETRNNTNTIYDHRIVLSGNNFSFLDDKMNLNVSVGATSKSTDFVRTGLRSTDQQVFGFFDHSGFTSQSQIEFKQRRNIIGVFGQALLDFDNYFFLNLSGRNDWVSNSVNNSLFYPSVSASFVPTTAFKGLQSDNGINYLKLRAGYGTSANFATGYPTVTVVDLDPTGWQNDDGPITSNTASNTIGNRNIRPELFEEIEFGAEGKLFNRLSFDVSYFTRTTTDLIVEDQPIPASTGALRTDSNIGQIDSNGIEADLGLNIFKSNTGGFDWKLNVNFTTFESEVIDLGQDTDLIIYAGFTNLGNGAKVGAPLGALFGSAVARDDQGNLLVDNAGNYVAANVDENDLLPQIGDSNPDFIMNYISTMSWKGLSFNVAFNHISGGDIYSTYVATLLGRGLTTDTENRLGTYILDGVNQDTGLPNNIQINNSDFYFTNGFASQADELSVYDASVLRLQEVSLGYSLPSKFLDKTPFGSLRLKVSGFNLWYDAYNTPEGINFDPNTTGLGAGNGAGFEFLTGPSSKRYGFSINATF